MAEPTKETRNSLLQLLVIAALLVFGYTCICTLSFTREFFNFLFVCAFFVIPFLAIRPVLRLRRRSRIFGLILLSPLLFLSSFLLLFTVACNGPGWSNEYRQPLKTFQMGQTTVQLQVLCQRRRNWSAWRESGTAEARRSRHIFDQIYCRLRLRAGRDSLSGRALQRESSCEGKL